MVLKIILSVFGGGLLGLSLAAPPGPMNAVIAEESVLRGWLAGFKAGLGAMTADAVFCVLAFAGVVTFVRDFSTLKGVMVGIGGLLMLYFAYGAYRDARSPSVGTDSDTNETDGSGGKGFQKAFVLAITNPYQITWWLTAGVALIESQEIVLGGETFVIGGIVVLISFFGGIGLWITGFPAALVLGERKTETFAPAVAYLSAVLLAGFGVLFLHDSVTTLAL